MKNIFSFVWIILVLGCGFISCKGDDKETSNVKGETTTVHVSNSETQFTNPGDIKSEKITEEEIPDNPVKKDSPVKDDSPQEEKVVENRPYDKIQEIKFVPESAGEIEFEEVVYDFGRIPQGEVVKKKFTFINIGKEPINIKSALPSCGCTAPSFPFIAIEPGDKGFIGVEFHSTNKMGLQRQTVLVKTDGKPAEVILHLNGIVVPKGDADPSSD